MKRAKNDNKISIKDCFTIEVRYKLAIENKY